MNTTLLFSRLKHWGLKGGLSIVDQGLYSGANFVLSILLARWLIPANYGIYSIAFAVYQFVFQAHNSLILEPMSVLGPAKMPHRLADYLRDQIKLHFFVSSLGGLFICVVGLLILLFNPTLGKVIILMGLVLSFILLPLLMRRVFYIFRKTETALVGSMVYLIVLCGILWIARTSVGMSVELAFPIIGVAGLISGLSLVKQMPKKKSELSSVLVTWSSNWDYGKFLVYSSFLIASAVQVQTFAVGAFLGLSDTGAFRALQNIVQPVILFFTAISAFVLPSLSFDYGSGNIVGLRSKGKYLLTLFLVVASCFEVLLLLFYPSIESLVYEGKFASSAYLLPVWGLVPIASAVTYVYYFLLQSIQRPRSILVGSLAWVVTSTVLSLVLSLQWGILGATLSVVAGYLASGIVFGLLYRYHTLKLKQFGS